MSSALILTILWTTLFTTRSTGFLQVDDNKLQLPGPEELVQRSDDVIKVPLRERARLEGEVKFLLYYRFIYSLECIPENEGLSLDFVGIL